MPYRWMKIQFNDDMNLIWLFLTLKSNNFIAFRKLVKSLVYSFKTKIFLFGKTKKKPMFLFEINNDKRFFFSLQKKPKSNVFFCCYKVPTCNIRVQQSPRYIILGHRETWLVGSLLLCLNGDEKWNENFSFTEPEHRWMDGWFGDHWYIIIVTQTSLLIVIVQWKKWNL